LETVDALAAGARERGRCDFMSIRRLAEFIGASTLDAFGALGSILSAERPSRYEPSLFSTI
jgi:hypothetical protein